MALVSGSQAVYLKALDMLGAQLQQLTLDLYGPHGRESVNLAAAAPNLAAKIQDFYTQNGRAPDLIFNDGKPPYYLAQLQSRPDFQRGTVIQYLTHVDQQGYSGDPAQIYVNMIPVFAVRVGAHGSFDTQQSVSYSEGDVQQITLTHNLDGAYNSRTASSWGASNANDPPIPISLVQFGAYQTWAIALLAIDHPELLYASDQGFVLTPDGVIAIEKSLPHWALTLEPLIFGGVQSADVDAFYGNGPVLYGVPYSIVSTLQSQFQARQKAGSSILNSVVQLMGIAVSLAGFAAGGAALSGLVGGAFTLSNFSGALTMASKFGVNTGDLQIATKLIGLTTGNISFSVPSSSTGGAMPPDVSFSDIGAGAVDPSQIDFSNLMPSDTIDAASWDAGVQIPSDWLSAGLDPTDPTMIDPSATLTDTPVMNDSGVELSGDQILSANETAQLDDAIYSGSVTQSQAVQDVASRIQSAAQSAGKMVDMSTILKDAQSIVGMAIQWTNAQNAKRGIVAPGSSVLTGPNGSKIITNPNGTKTILYPNGQVATLPATYRSPGVSGGGFSTLVQGLTSNPVALAIGGAVVVALLMRGRR